MAPGRVQDNQKNAGLSRQREIDIISALPWVKNIARNLFYRVRFTGISLDDCVGAATVGYIESVEKVRDVDVGSLKFKSYAYLRMRGHVFRTAFTTSDFSAQCSASYERRRERVKSVLPEPAAVSLVGFKMVVLEVALGHLLDEYAINDFFSTHDGCPYQSYEENQFSKILYSAMLGLSESSRAIISLHYFHGLSFTDIATSMQMSKARVSQLHKRGLELMLAKISSSQQREDF